MATPAAPSARADAVRELLGTFVKSLKDHRTYPPNNPLLPRRRDDVLARLALALGDARELTLGVSPEALTFEGREVYRSADPRDSLALQLYRHGLRELRLGRGLSPDELRSLFEALIAPLGDDDLDDDLCTLLWERDLRNVRYTAVDDVPVDAAWAANPVATVAAHLATAGPEAGRPTWAAILRDAAARAPRNEAADLAAVAMSAGEIEALRRLSEEDRRRDLFLEVVDVLLEVLRAGVAPGESQEILQILQRVVEVSVEELNFRRATAILRQLGSLAAKSALASAIQPVLVHFSKARAVAHLVELVKDGTGFDERAFHDYLLQLTAPAAAPLAEGFMVVEDRKTRKVICEAIAELVKNDVSVLAGLARDARWYVARNVAYILGLTRNPDGLRSLKLLAAHAHPRVRAEALRSASQFHSPIVREMVLKGLRDPDGSVLLAACEAAPRFRDPVLCDALEALLRDKAWTRRGALEKRAIAVAYGRAAGEAALPRLGEILVQRGLFRRRIDDGHAAAAAGIAAIGTSSAVAALRRAANEDRDLAPVVEQALRETATPADRT